MQIIERKFEDHSNVFLVKMDEADVEEWLQRAYEKLVKNVQVDGFRKGKAPRAIVEKIAGGKVGLIEEVHDEMMQIVKMQLSQDPEYLGISEIMVSLAGIEPDVVLEVVSPQAAEIEIGDYKNIRVPEVKSEFSEAKVDEAIEDLRKDKADYGPTERTTVQSGDMTLFDIVGKVGDDVILDQKDAQYIVRPGSPYPMRGFADGLIGATVGKNKTINVTVPDEFPKEEYRGQKAKFIVSLKEIKEQLLPELDDEFAKSFGDDFKTMDDVRTRIRQNLSYNYGSSARKAWDEAVLEAAMAKATLKYPSSMIGEEIAEIMNEDMMRIRNNSKNAADFTKQLEGLDRDDMVEKYTPVAKESVEKALYMRKFIELENITLTDEELDEEINNALSLIEDEKEREERRAVVTSEEYKFKLKNIILTEKATQRLREIASGDTPKKASKAKAKTEEASTEEVKPKTPAKKAATAKATKTDDTAAKATKPAAKKKATKADEVVAKKPAAKPRAKKTDA